MSNVRHHFIVLAVLPLLAGCASVSEALSEIGRSAMRTDASPATGGAGNAAVTIDRNGVIGHRNAVNEYRFFGTEGQEIIGFLQGTSGAFRPGVTLRVYNPTGNARLAQVQSPGNSGFLESRASGPFVLPETGAYLVRVSGDYQDNRRNTYRFRVQELDRAPSAIPARVVPGRIVSGEKIDYPHDVDEYHFHGRTGQRLQAFIQGLSGAFRPGVILRVYNPAGNARLVEVRSPGTAPTMEGNGSRVINLPETGTYIVRVTGEFDQSGQRENRYRFLIQLEEVSRAAPVDPERAIEFPDPILEAVIREAIGRTHGEILPSHLRDLTALNARGRAIRGLPGGRAIRSLSGLEHARNLRTLEISGNRISSLGPVAALADLEVLVAGFDEKGEDSNTFSDLSPLSGLRNLRVLQLNGLRLSDIQPLGRLQGLETLQLRFNPLGSLWPLQGLTGLKELDITGTRQTDLSPIRNLVALEELRAMNLGLEDLTPLSRLTSLRTLYLVGNNIADISPLSGLVNLEVLIFTGDGPDRNRIADLSPLSSLTRLRILWLGGGGPLSQQALCEQIPALQARGVRVSFSGACEAWREDERRPAPTPESRAEAQQVDLATAGTLAGKVILRGMPEPRTPLNMASEPRCHEMHPTPPLAETVVRNEDGTLRWVFVYLKEGLDERYAFPVPQEPVLLDQRGCIYTPRVFGIQTGQSLQFRNSNAILHNVSSRPQVNRGFNFTQPVAGMVTRRTFDKPEIMVPIVSRVHPWMAAYGGIVEHPYFSVTGEDGTFRLDNVPPGEYVIEAWHERYGTTTQRVTLGPNETKEIQFVFTAR